ncbi:NADPH:quinone oxidoreductase [Hydrogenophaga sp. PBC]|uniref:NADPH:quinone reductase n=1 Tax=Hydrogenophaga sp. PBC TaxID=795665 RepID=UPI000260887F|nr:NADPH:quinone reductase [Hydrogenophaga sp. PBC]AOS79115.1 NADPH:quinone oxidoreductase [Hydrogenophaga sp. PBC]
MKAAFYEAVGPAEQVLRVEDIPQPQPAPGEVRVRVAWSGVNPSDVKSRAGLRSKAPAFPRVIPHSDGSGTIDAVGEGVDQSRVGERVWLWNAAWGRPHGTACEWLCLPQQQAVRLPEGTSGEAGACLGIPALTALHAVLMDGGVAGKTVLVAGGAGAVGHYAVQMAGLLGAARVISTVSSDQKARIATEAGADDVVNYKTEPLAQRVAELTQGQGVDRIIELDLAASAEADIAMLKPGGEVVVYGSGASPMALPFFPLIVKNVQLKFFMVYHLSAADRARAEGTLNRMLERDALQHLIAERLPLDRIADAHQLVESGRAIGNVVLRVGADA